MSWLGRVFRGTRGEAAATDVSCAFCGLHRRELRKLIAGPRAHICDGCVALCVDILDDEARREGGAGVRVDGLIAAAARMGARAPHAELGPLLRALIELARGRRDVLRAVVTIAWHADDLVTALAALEAIGGDARACVDDLDRVRPERSARSAAGVEGRVARGVWRGLESARASSP